MAKRHNAGRLDYELIDFGNGRKLERFGKVVLDRPEILASSRPQHSLAQWQRMADATYHTQSTRQGMWVQNRPIPEDWNCTYQHSRLELAFGLKLGAFKHVGLFPEQLMHWDFLANAIKKGDRFLNLFAYTGASSLIAAALGADVFHVDSSKSVLKWASANAALNGISNIHWVLEDALKFAERENKRGNTYAGIIMDPPVFGKSPDGKNWILNDFLESLVSVARELLVARGFLILNTYSPTVSLARMVDICKKYGFEHNVSDWLHVDTLGGQQLSLSKFLRASAK